MSLHQQETLQEGDSVEELRQRPLLLLGYSAEVQEHRLQTCKTPEVLSLQHTRKVKAWPLSAALVQDKKEEKSSSWKL